MTLTRQELLSLFVLATNSCNDARLAGNAAAGAYYGALADKLDRLWVDSARRSDDPFCVGAATTTAIEENP